MKKYFFLLLLSLVMLKPSASDYMDVREPNRLALLIGHSEYDHLTHLPSVKTDLIKMESALKEMNYDVSVYSEAKARSNLEIEDDVMPEFRKKVKDGDLVLIYLSGHGFSYGGFNYFAPSTMSNSFPEKDLHKQALLIESMVQYFAKKHPAAIVLLVDACRTVSGFIETEDGHKYTSKGAADSRNNITLSVNLIAGFAALPGQAALTSSIVNEPSIYTKYLSKEIIKKDERFDDIHNDISAMVQIESNDVQRPSTVSWSTITLYLNPTEVTKALQKEKWLSALSTQTKEAVEFFIIRNPLNPYIVSARKWLKDAESFDEAKSFTRISPYEVDKAWNNNFRSQSQAYAASISPTLPVAFPRNASISTNKTDSNICNSGYYISSLDACQTALMLSSLDKVVLTSHSYARHRPNFIESPLTALSPNKRIQTVYNLTTYNDGTYWLGGVDEQVNYNRDDAVYLSLGVDHSLEQRGLGIPIYEFDVEPNPDRFPGLINREKLESQINSLKNNGYSITWASITAGQGVDDEAFDLKEKATHTRLVLIDAGISSKIVTIIHGAQTVKNGSIKVRIFGNRI